jgi:hypothetical protein
MTRAQRQGFADGEQKGAVGTFRALPAGADLDGRTAAYVLETRATFEALRNAAGHLAGLLVLAAIGARERVLDEPILAQAESAYREAEDKLRLTAPPPAGVHHHHHLSLASERIGEALRVARRGSLRLNDASLDRAHRVLRAGWREMLFASRALPGFQVVDFAQSCCAAHRARVARLHTPTE